MRTHLYMRVYLYAALFILLLCFGHGQAKAQNIYNTGFENFSPTNWQGWSADNGIWQIGTPPATSGPGSSYDGTLCAGTDMSAGVYQVNISSRLISPPINLPTVSANQQINLTFWHWFSWSQYTGSGNVAGTGNVQVSTDGGSSWATVSNPATGNSAYNGYSNGWSLGSVDLSAYAGKQIQFAFQQAGGTIKAPGWYIDDISVDTVTSQLLLLNQTIGFENFTSSNWQGWSADNGVWQIGAPPAASGPGSAYDGLQCLGTAMQFGVYPANTSSRFVSPPAILPAITSGQKIALTFWQWFNWDPTGRYGPPGTGNVQVSAWSNGAWGAWTTVSGTYSGNSDGWAEVGISYASVDLSAYAGQKIQIGFQQIAGFDDYVNSYGQMYNYNPWPGWYIDDVTLSVPKLTPNLTSISPATVAVGSPTTPIILTGINFATNAQAYWNGHALATTGTSTQLTATIPASDLTTVGTFNITVVNPGSNGGTSNALPFGVIKPGLIVAFTSPSAGAAVKGTVTVTGTITDTMANLGTWTLTQPLSGIQLAAGTGANPSVSWNTKYWADGTATLTLTETDAKGNTGSANLTVTINNGGVTSIAITNPLAGAVVKGAVTVTGAITDLTPGTWTLVDNGVQIGSGTGLSPSVSWNTAQMADGTNKLVLTETDAAGNTDSATSTVTVNNKGITSIKITAPAASAVVAGTVNVTGTIADASPGTWTLTDNGVQIGAGSGLSPSVSWDTTKVADGLNKLVLTETDVAGNSASTNITVTVNNKGVSSVVITAPANGAVVRGTVTVKGTIVDATLGAWTLTDNGTQIGAGTGAAPSVVWSTTPEPDGAHTLVLKETDLAGHVGSASITVTVNNTGVSAVAITAPPNGAVVKGSVTVTGTITDATPGNWTLNCDGVQLGSGTGKAVSVPWNTALFADGIHKLVLAETDAAGNTGTATVSVTVNNKSVSSVVITAPTNGAIVRGKITITGTITDSTPGTWTLTCDGAQITGGSGTGNSVAVSWDTTKVADGLHKLVLSETDTGGNTGSATVTVTVNNNGVTAVAITSPANNAVVSGTVTVTGTITDANPGTWKLTCSGTQIGSGTGATVSVLWATTAWAEGAHALILTETDAAGNTGSATITVTINNKGVSSVALTSPANGAFVKGNVTVTGTITDATPGTWALTCDGAQIGTGTGLTVSVSWDTTKVADGSHKLVLSETDAAGHTGSATVTVTVNNTGVVSVVITSPTNGAAVKGTVTVTGAITDATPGTWTLTCDGAQLGTGTGKTVSVVWNTKVFALGSHKLILTETDAAGNTGSASVTVTVSN